MRVKRVLAIGVLSLVLALSSMALFGCGGNSDEQAIRNRVSSELDMLKNASDEGVAAFTEGAGEDAFMDFGISNEQFVKEYFAGFDYAIDSITIDGDTATVQVTLTIRTLSDFQEVFTAKTEEFVASDEMLAFETEDELNQKLGELLIDSIKSTELVTTDPISITYNKVDGEWVADNAAGDVISEAMM